MRSSNVMVAALAVVLYAAPGCPAGSLDSPSSGGVSPNIEATSGLLSSDPSNLESTLSGSSNEVATGAEQTPTGELNAILNAPSLLASAPGSSDVPVPASPALPGTASEFGGAAAGHLPGDPQNSSRPPYGAPSGCDDQLANPGKGPSIGITPPTGAVPIAKDGAPQTSQVDPTVSSLGGAETFSLSFDAAPAKTSAQNGAVSRVGAGKNPRPLVASNGGSTGLTTRLSLCAPGLLGLAAILLVARRLRHDAA